MNRRLDAAPDIDTLDAYLRSIFSSEFDLFCLYYDPEFFSLSPLEPIMKPHLKAIADPLQQITDGEISKLILAFPPRAGKSYTVSMWCAWMIGRGAGDPSTSIMRNSYGQTLAEKFSYDIRIIIQSEAFLRVFPNVRMQEDRGRIDDWSIAGAKQSTYFCAGVGGAITGKGCKTAAILDDPIKNLEEALSLLLLDKDWLWYLSTHKSRMESGCPEIHIATRWSRGDIIGRILDSKEGPEYEVVTIPALTDEGKSFCETVKTTEEYMALRAILDPFIWEAEYMQHPIEAKGLLFPLEELKRFTIEELQKNPKLIDTIIGYTDTADEGADYLASLTVALSGRKCFLVDVVFTQDPIEVTESLVAQQIIENGHRKHTVESNAGGKSFGRNVARLIAGKSRCHVSWKLSLKNKETRILMQSGAIKQSFYFRSDIVPGSQYDRFMRQLGGYLKMGTNQPDDAPDALTGAAEMVFRPGIRFLSNQGTN
jgi:predicted phage terminase large subunit-like protein